MIPITYQLPVETSDGVIHIFQKDALLPALPPLHCLLINYGGPNVTGPDVGYHNQVCQIGWEGQRQRYMLTLAGYREGAMNLEDVKETLRGWIFTATLGKRPVKAARGHDSAQDPD